MARPRRKTIDNILNQPRRNWGVLFAGIGLSLLCFFFVSKYWGVVLVPGLVSLSHRVTKRDRRMWSLLGLSFFLGSSYDPRQ